MKLRNVLSIVFISVATLSFAQSMNKETINFQTLVAPKIATEINNRTYKITVSSPYNLTKEQVIQQERLDYNNKITNFDTFIEKGKLEYEQKLKDYDKEVALAKEKFEIESAAFKKLSLLEKLTLTDQNKNPKLKIPAKPEYLHPTKPVYVEPNLNNYLILDNEVLGSQIQISGLSKSGANYEISVNIDAINLQDNNGQTFGNQPTNIQVKQSGQTILNQTLFKDLKLVSSSPTNNINKVLIEKANINNILKEVNIYLNEQLGYQAAEKSIELLTIKNKDGKYDDLEKAQIYASTNLKKLNPENPEMTAAAMAGLQKATDIWESTVSKVDFKEKKAPLNAKVGALLYFNLIRLNLAFDNKKEAEKWLNAMQENIIYMDLSSSESNAVKQIESEIYKSK